MEEALTMSQDVLIQFMIYLLAPEQIKVSQEAQLVFLKNLNKLKALYQAEGQGDQRAKEEDTNKAQGSYSLQ